MSKQLWLADLHIGLNGDNPVFHKAVLELFNEIEDVCVRNDINEIVCFGDLFHSRKSLSQMSLTIAQKIVQICNKRQLYLIRGNHDTFHDSKAQPNWLSAFREHSNVVTIENEPLYLNNMCLVPWGYNIKLLNWSGYLLGHFAINGFKMNDSCECYKSAYNSTDFSQFQHTYSGHFHLPSSSNNITYLGSPFQHNFGDTGSKRGYYVFDNDELTFNEFTLAPKFFIISTNNINDDKITGNFVKLVFDKDYGTTTNNQIIEHIESLNPVALFVNLANIDSTDDLILDDSTEFDTETVPKTNNDLIFEFLDAQQLPDHIKRPVLYKIVSSMLSQEIE